MKDCYKASRFNMCAILFLTTIISAIIDSSSSINVLLAFIYTIVLYAFTYISVKPSMKIIEIGDSIKRPSLRFLYYTAITITSVTITQLFNVNMHKLYGIESPSSLLETNSNAPFSLLVITTLVGLILMVPVWQAISVNFERSDKACKENNKE